MWRASGTAGLSGPRNSTSSGRSNSSSSAVSTPVISEVDQHAGAGDLVEPVPFPRADELRGHRADRAADRHRRHLDIGEQLHRRAVGGGHQQPLAVDQPDHDDARPRSSPASARPSAGPWRRCSRSSSRRGPQVARARARAAAAAGPWHRRRPAWPTNETHAGDDRRPAPSRRCPSRGNGPTPAISSGLSTMSITTVSDHEDQRRARIAGAAQAHRSASPRPS